MATLGLKEMGKFLWEDRENEGEREGLGEKNNKICWQQWGSNPQPRPYQTDALTNFAIWRLAGMERSKNVSIFD